MGEFKYIHLDLITYSSKFDAKTILDLCNDYINKNLRIPFCYLKLLKIKQKLNDIVCENKYWNGEIHKFESVTSCKKTCHLHYYIKRCEKHFNVIRLLNIK